MSTDEVASAFAALLRQHRLAAGLTQADLAERAGLSVRGISDLERGIKRPRMDTVALLLRALSLDGTERAAFERASRRARLLPGEQVAPARTAAPTDLPTGGYLGAVSPFPLVARQAELAQVTAALEAAGHGGSRLLALAGEPGIGKTRLAQEVMLQMRAGGWLTLVGRCYEEDQRSPYFPFRQVLTAAWDATSPTLRQRARERFSALGRLLPELLPEPPAAEGEEARLRLLSGVAGLLGALAEDRPLLVLLDDLHWADQASLDLLRHLVRFTHGIRVLGTYRDVEVDRRHPLEQTLSELVRERLVDTRPLLPLSVEGTAALIALHLGQQSVFAEQRDAIHAHAAGNPFFTTELVAVLREQRVLPRAATAATSGATPQLVLPESVRSLVGQRVGRLAPAAQELLRLASVLGQEFDLELLLAAADQPEETVLMQVDAALAVRLLEERQVGRAERLAFSHALIAQVLYQAMPRYRLRRLHLRVALALERLRGADAEVAAELGRHYLAGGEPGQAVGYLERAGDHTRAQQGRAAAEGFYREAVEWLDRLRRPLDAARVREQLGSLLSTGGQYADAWEILEPAAAAYRAAGNLEATGRVVAHIGRLSGSLGRPGDGLARLESMLTLLAPCGASPAVAALCLTQGVQLALLGSMHDGLAAVEKAVALCRMIGDQDQLGEALMTRSAVCYSLWRLPEALRTLNEVLRGAEAAGDRAAATFCWAASFVGGIYEQQGSFAAGTEIRERALQIAVRYSLREHEVRLRTSLGWMGFLSGDWAAARTWFEQAVAVAREIGPSTLDHALHHNLGTFLLAEGADAEAAAHLSACERDLVAGTMSGVMPHFHVPRILAERDLLAGQPELARARLAPLLDNLAPDAVEGMPLLHMLAWSLHDLGQVDEAAALATRGVSMARETGARLLLVDSLRVAAMIAVRQEHWDRAAEGLQEGLLLAQEIGYPSGEARLLQVAGDFYVRRGQPDLARERWEAALAIAQRLGARRVAEQAVSALETGEKARTGGA